MKADGHDLKPKQEQARIGLTSVLYMLLWQQRNDEIHPIVLTASLIDRTAHYLITHFRNNASYLCCNWLHLIINGRTISCLVLFCSHLSRVPSIRLQIGPELDVLRGNGILSNVRQQKQRQSRTKNAQGGADEKRILTATNAIGAAGSMVLDNWKDVGSDKGADFAERSCEGIVLTADGRGACFGGYETDIVTRAGFAK